MTAVEPPSREDDLIRLTAEYIAVQCVAREEIAEAIRKLLTEIRARRSR
jgi:hypothetical protein